MGTIQIKRGTKSALATNNLTLLAGQPCFETDTGQMKVGNGINKWNDLPYIGGNSAGSNLYYGQSSTSSYTAAKVSTISDFKLEIGAIVIIEFVYNNAASNPTLNINSTGAKPIKYNNINYNNLLSNSSYIIRYDGTSYNIVGGLSGEIRSGQYFIDLSQYRGTVDINTRSYFGDAGDRAVCINLTNASGSDRRYVEELYITGGLSDNNNVPDLNKKVNLHVGSLSLGNALFTYDSSSNAVKISFI